MCSFHYNFIKMHFDAELLFSKPDSFSHEIKSEDVHDEFFKHKYSFNFRKFFKEFKVCFIIVNIKWSLAK